MCLCIVNLCVNESLMHINDLGLLNSLSVGMMSVHVCTYVCVWGGGGVGVQMCLGVRKAVTKKILPTMVLNMLQLTNSVN